MKKYIFVMLLVSLLVLAFPGGVLAAALHQDGTPPVATIPEWAVALLRVVLVWLLTSGIKALSRTLPWVVNLEGQGTALVGALVALIVAFGNGLLGMIPPEYQPGILAFLGFVGTLLSAYGLQFTVKMFVPQKK